MLAGLTMLNAIGILNAGDINKLLIQYVHLFRCKRVWRSVVAIIDNISGLHIGNVLFVLTKYLREVMLVSHRRKDGVEKVLVLKY